jgi:hypothetical protein
MAYRQYTKCVDPSGFVGFTWVQYVMAGGAGVVAGYVALLLSGAIVPGLLIAALSAIIAYCNWWLYDRLICLGGDVCAVGFVLTTETPAEKSGFDAFDTDYSLNLVIPPNVVGATQGEVENSVPLGYLEKEQPGVTDYSFLGYHLPFSGNLITRFSNGDPYGGQFVTACLHAEFEGAGVYDLLQAAEAALALAVAAAVACSVPIIGWIACLILNIVSAVVTIAGIVNALNDTGNPTDVNTNLSSIQSAQSPDGAGADILLVQGTWVYDSAHSGWNEIHPIKWCQKIGAMIGQQWHEIQIASAVINPATGQIIQPAQLQSIPDVNAWINGWCGAIGIVTQASTVAAQQQPENQWVVHPLVDGCEPAPRPPR